jgi:hypothetical protein
VAIVMTGHEAQPADPWVTHELELADGKVRYCGLLRSPAARRSRREARR